MDKKLRDCPVCGEAIPEDDSVCPNCGALLDEPAYDALDDEEDF